MTFAPHNVTTEHTQICYRTSHLERHLNKQAQQLRIDGDFELLLELCYFVEEAIRRTYKARNYRFEVTLDIFFEHQRSYSPTTTREDCEEAWNMFDWTFGGSNKPYTPVGE